MKFHRHSENSTDADHQELEERLGQSGENYSKVDEDIAEVINQSSGFVLINNVTFTNETTLRIEVDVDIVSTHMPFVKFFDSAINLDRSPSIVVRLCNHSRPTGLGTICRLRHSSST